VRRRVALKRGQPLRSKRRLKPVSDKRRSEMGGRAAVRAEVFARDGHRCRLAGVEGAGPCFGRLTPHHLRKASAGGAYTLDNLVALCEHHNDLVEDRPGWGVEMGLVIR